jgi:hypothetical protein
LISGRSGTPRDALKIAALAPIPSARVSTTGIGQANGSREQSSTRSETRATNNPPG